MNDAKYVLYSSGGYEIQWHFRDCIGRCKYVQEHIKFGCLKWRLIEAGD